MTTELSISKIEQHIYFIRGRQVMLDSDLAQLYGVETRVLNQAVRRNEKRFPGEDFTFRLNVDEYNSLRSSSVTLERNDKNPLKSDGYNSSVFETSLRSPTVTLESGRGKHRKYLPTVYTEYGTVMLAGLLQSSRAIEVNVAVVKTFVELRERENPLSNLDVKMERKFAQIDQRFEQIDQKIDQHSQTLLSAIQRLQFPTPRSIDRSAEIKKSETLVYNNGIKNVIDTISTAVAQHFCIKIQDLKSKSRVRQVSLPRQIALYLIRKHTSLGFRNIGKVFGGKDHSTILHAYQKIQSSINEDESIRESVAAIEERVQLEIRPKH